MAKPYTPAELAPLLWVSPMTPYVGMAVEAGAIDAGEILEQELEPGRCRGRVGDDGVDAGLGFFGGVSADQEDGDEHDLAEQEKTVKAFRALRYHVLSWIPRRESTRWLGSFNSW